MLNKYGKKSQLYIRVGTEKGKSILEENRFTAPFKILSPFYDEEERMSLMIVSVSAGIMEGDRQEILIETETGAEVRIGSQSYEKIHKMKPGGSACRQTELRVRSGSSLIYEPLPMIPFAESAFSSDTVVYLEDRSSALFYGEILSCGRAACEERFQYRYFRSGVRIYQRDALVYMERTVYEPEVQEMEGFCMYEGFTHLSNLLLMNIEAEDKQIHDILEKYPETEGGFSRTGSGGVCIRVLGNGAESLIKIQEEVKIAVMEKS